MWTLRKVSFVDQLNLECFSNENSRNQSNVKRSKKQQRRPHSRDFSRAFKLFHVIKVAASGSPLFLFGREGLNFTEICESTSPDLFIYLFIFH